MAVVMTPIYTQTVGAGGAGSVTFNNIPQFYTDLMVVASARTVNTGVFSYQMILNNNTTAGIYSHTTVGGNGSAASSYRNTLSYVYVGEIPTSSNTANTFSSTSVYLPNYTGSNFKQMVIDNVTENNATLSYIDATAHTFLSTAAVTRVDFSAFGINFAQHSTFSLYGILRPGA